MGNGQGRARSMLAAGLLAGLLAGQGTGRIGATRGAAMRALPPAIDASWDRDSASADAPATLRLDVRNPNPPGAGARGMLYDIRMPGALTWTPDGPGGTIRVRPAGGTCGAGAGIGAFRGAPLAADATGGGLLLAVPHLAAGAACFEAATVDARPGAGIWHPALAGVAYGGTYRDATGAGTLGPAGTPMLPITARPAPRGAATTLAWAEGSVASGGTATLVVSLSDPNPAGPRETGALTGILLTGDLLGGPGAGELGRIRTGRAETDCPGGLARMVDRPARGASRAYPVPTMEVYAPRLAPGMRCTARLRVTYTLIRGAAATRLGERETSVQYALGGVRGTYRGPRTPALLVWPTPM